MFVWDSYGPGEVNEKIQYWVDLWEDLIANFNERLYGLDLINPQLIITEIIDEIRSTHFQNKEGKSYFKERLSELVGQDPILKGRSSSDFVLLLKEFNTGTNLYLLQLAKVVLGLLQNGQYFDAASNHLRAILRNPPWEENDEQTIAILTQHLIVELLLRGYSLDTIQSLPRNLFDKYEEREGRLFTRYPLNANWREFLEGDNFNRERFNQEARAEIDSLDIEQRLARFSSYYTARPLEGYFIFRIEGLKGKVDFSIGDVNFYSPKDKRYIKDEAGIRPFEDFGTVKDREYVNAAVRLRFIDHKAAKVIAGEIADRALDIIRCYVPVKTSLEVIREDYVIADLDGQRMAAGRAMSDRHEVYRWLQAFNLDDFPIASLGGGGVIRLLEGLGEFSFAPVDKQSEIERKIVYSLHWYRKAEESGNVEDKLLNYWIVIENLLNLTPSPVNALLPINTKESSYAIAKELLPRLHISEFIYDVGHKLYWYLRRLLESGQLTLQPDLIEACELNLPLGGEIELNPEPFINKLPELTNEVGRKLVRDKCLFAYRFYNEPDFAKKELIKQMNQIRQDVLLIYRYRNRIVHNAHFDTTVLPYFVQKARKFAETVLKRIVYERTENKVATVEEIIVADFARVNRILDKLERRESLNFFRLEF